MCAQAVAGSASASAAPPRIMERARRSVRTPMLRSSGSGRERPGGPALAQRGRAEQPEHVGADGVEQADQRERARSYSWCNAAELQVRGQVRGDEHELEAAGEEGERHEQVAAVPHRLAQGFAEI